MVLINRHFILFATGWLIFGFTSWYLFYNVQIVHEQIVLGDDRFSQLLDNAIRAFLDQNKHLVNLTKFDLLKNNFPMIDHLKIKYTGLNKINVQFASQDLMYRLGSKLVLTKNSDVFLTSDFSHAALRDLPVIYLHNLAESPNDIEPEQKLLLQNLSDFVIQDYEIHWHNLNQIYLVDKQNSSFKLLIRSDQIITLQLLAICQKLLVDYLANHKNKKNREIVADLRFNGQIIVSG